MSQSQARATSAAALARVLGLDRETVQQWCRTGKVNAYKRANAWRIPAAEVGRIVALRTATDSRRKRSNRRERYSLPLVTTPGGTRAQWDADLERRLNELNATDPSDDT